LSIIICDIDHFKQINDTYGHQAGDQFLIEIAQLMLRFTRGSDIICRYGGEEFLLILSGTNQAAARERAEEIRGLCSQLIIRHEGRDLRATISLGIATFPAQGSAAEEIIIKADKALYQSKQNGRNQVKVWEEPL
jgi:diguanylate cyclase (GGDEF)-like protein